MEGQLRPSPAGPRTSFLPLTSVPLIYQRSQFVLLPPRPTRSNEVSIMMQGVTTPIVGIYCTSLYCLIGVPPTHSNYARVDSAEQPRKHVPVTIQPPTPPPSLTSLTTPHAIISKSDPPSLLLSVSIGNLWTITTNRAGRLIL